MSHFRKISGYFSFLNPFNFIWKNTNSEPIQANESDQFSMESLGEILKTSEFANDAQDICDEARGKGEAVVEQHICSMVEQKKYTDVIQLRKFIDELGKKFLNQSPEAEYRNTKDSFERFQKLQNIVDMEAVMKRFKKAESYEIKPYTEGKQPLTISFIYPDGTSENYPLELSATEKKDVIGKFLRGIIESIEVESKKANDKNSPRILEPHELKDDLAMIKEMEEETDPEKKELMEKALKPYQARFREEIREFSEVAKLGTPEASFDKLSEIAPSFSDELRTRLSKPLSRMAQRYESIIEELEQNGVVEDPGASIKEHLFAAAKILNEEYPGEELSPEVEEALNSIIATFYKPVI